MTRTYEFDVAEVGGNRVSLSDFAGKVILVVNVASLCGQTFQYEGLEALYREYRERGFEVLGFPTRQFSYQELDSVEEVHEFCRLTYDVSFPLFAQVDVNGPHADPFFEHLRREQPSDFGPQYGEFYDNISKLRPDAGPDEVTWNFTKFLIDREGRVVRRFEPPVLPEAIGEAVEKYL